MPQSLSKIYVHLIFSTKNREHYLFDEIQPHLFSFIGGVLKNMDCNPINIGGFYDHVHILFVLNKTRDISEVVREVKVASSKWYTEHTRHTFNWQAGYGAFSIGHSQLEKVKEYILNQRMHHHAKTFKEEFLGFLQKYEVPYDERFVLD